MALERGTRLGPYEIIAQIGRGGMEGYRARDGRLDRDVAIKVLPEAVAVDPDRVRRFQQEARAVAALNHPNICQIHDVGSGYLVLEFVDGKSPHGPLPTDKTLKLALQIANALEAAHRCGILHRDLKPGNMLVTADGTIKLLDFGLARLIGLESGPSDVTRTMDGVVLGTAAYMSPEQVQGKPVDQRSDVFSFGAVLYEWLTGQRAFEGETAASVLGAILHGGPALLDASPLERIVRRCLEKEPSRRYQAMAEVRAALEDVSRGTPDDEPSIAVLPFANLSDDRDNEYFSDGLAEEIINLLVKIPGLKVTARTSAFAFRGRNADIRRIAETLGVVHILEGSVRKFADRIRVTAQLVKAEDGFHLWSERYDKTLRDVFAVQDEIAAAISTALQIKLSAQPALGPRYTPNLAAYEAYLKSRYHLWKYTPESVTLSREHCEHALALDPQFALPHIGLADRLLVLASGGHIRADEAMPENIWRALAVYSSLPEAHAMLGIVAVEFDRNWSAAERHFQMALAPRRAVSSTVRQRDCHFYLQPVGRAHEAVEQMRRVLEEDPLSAQAHWGMALYLLAAGEDAAASNKFHRFLELDNNFWPSLFGWGMLLALEGRLNDAVGLAERARALVPWLRINVGLLAGVLMRDGEDARANELLRELESSDSWVRPSSCAIGVPSCRRRRRARCRNVREVASAA